MKKKLGRILVVLLSIALCMQLMVPLASPVVSAATVVTVDPSFRHQTMDGWGTSIAWWGNMIGGWTQPGQYDTSKSRRDELIDMLYSDEGIGLNILRYNIGGGDDPSHTHQNRLEGKMQGFKTSASAAYDWSRDANQVYSMEQAIANRAESRAAKGISSDVITEFFSNSPPYWMTESNCSSGNGNANSTSNNLSNNNMNAFAQYLGDVTRYFAEKKGIVADYLVPLNEAGSDYWSQAKNGNKQEGCKFTPGTTQNNLYNALRNQSLPAGTTLSGLDETNTSLAASSWNSLSADNRFAFSKYGTHTYSANFEQRVALRDRMASDEKKLWMSEVCDSAEYNGEGWAPNSMATPMLMSGKILADLKDMKVSAWVFWQAIENLMECTKWNGNWGLITAAYYLPTDAPGNYWTRTESGGLPNNNFSKYNLNWNTNVSVGDYWVGKSYYMLGQYSKFIRQGYTIVEIGTGSELAAISPDGKELVIVATNDSTSNVEKNYVVAGASNLTHAEVYRTAVPNDENLKRLPNITSVSNSSGFTYTLTPRSVTTFVVKASDRIYDGTTSRIVNDRVQGTGTDKFSYTGSWSDRTGSSNAANTYDLTTRRNNTNGSTVTLTFTGTRAQIYGTKGSGIGNWTVSVDNGPTIATVTGNSSPTGEKQVIADSGELPYDTHTLKITKTNASYCYVDYGMIYNSDSSKSVLVDKTALNAKIAAVQSTLPGNYTTASWNTFQDARTKANLVTNERGASQADVDTTLDELDTAFAGLTSAVVPVDKTLLNEKIAQAENLDGELYTAGTWSFLQIKLNEAKIVSANLGATQGDVDAAHDTLHNAIIGLERKPLVWTALLAAIASYGDLIPADWSTASWNSMKAFYDAAVDINGDTTVSQSDINTAAANLVNAIASLAVDKSALAAAILSFDGLTKDDWSTTSWNSTKAVYDGAVLVNGDPDAKQGEVDATEIALASAIAALAVDKSALAAAILSFDGLIKDDWSPASWSSVKGFYDVAVALNNSNTSKQSEVNAAATNLTNAIPTLSVDKSALTAAIASYGTLNKDDWPSESWNSLTLIYNDAVLLNESSAAKQSEVKAVSTALVNAIAALSVDKSALAAAILSFDGLTKDDWSPASWNSMKAVYDSAVLVNGDPDAKQSAITTAAANLVNAIAGLTVDKTALSAAIASYGTLTETDWSPASWSSAKGFYNTAAAANNNNAAKQSAIDTAAANLVKAIAGLTVDKTTLNARINAVKGTAQGYYTDASWGAFQSALSTAQSVSASASATQSQVVGALDALNSASAGLTLKPVDKAALNARIAEMKNTTKGYHTEASWSTFQGALSAAQSASTNAGATQGQVNDALSALNSAFAGLKLNPVSKTLLDIRINEVKGTALNYFTETSRAAFQGALSNAQSISANAGATQRQVNDALAALNAAYSGLQQLQKPAAISSTNVRLSYKGRQQLQASGEGLTWSSSNSNVSVNPGTGEITSVKGFTASAVITAGNAMGSVDFHVKVQPTFVQWLLIIFLFGWIWM